MDAPSSSAYSRSSYPLFQNHRASSADSKKYCSSTRMYPPCAKNTWCGVATGLSTAIIFSHDLYFLYGILLLLRTPTGAQIKLSMLMEISIAYMISVQL